MLVIQEHKAHCVSSRLHLPHGLGQVELTTNYFLPYNLHKYQWGSVEMEECSVL
jgi:hypothetical protein